MYRKKIPWQHMEYYIARQINLIYRRAWFDVSACCGLRKTVTHTLMFFHIIHKERMKYRSSPELRMLFDTLSKWCSTILWNYNTKINVSLQYVLSVWSKESFSFLFACVCVCVGERAVEGHVDMPPAYLTGMQITVHSEQLKIELQV